MKFGTDGVRGIANKDLNAEIAYQIGKAAAYVLANGKSGTVIIGKDTRRSGDLLESAIAAGFMAMGLNVLSLGVLPTPAIAYLTVKYKALLGVVISASHNPGEYNGIKFFSSDGFKLPDETEEMIEKFIENKIPDERIIIGEEVGIYERSDRGAEDYINYLLALENLDLNGLKIAMDCGHGALYKIAPELFKRMGANVKVINVEPDGININRACGSTNPEIMCELVKKEGADIGVSFDGDGDRIIAADEKGNIINGDHILAINGIYLYKTGKLKNNTIVGTVMTNMGLNIFLEKNGINIVQTAVGDRYILDEMRKSGYVLGGEQSGHIIHLQQNTTGDGLATAINLIKSKKHLEAELSELNELFLDMPQVLINAKVNNELKYDINHNKEITDEIERVEKCFEGKGRVVIRPSGTEPLVRVMIEADCDLDIEEMAISLAKFIEKKLV